VVEETTSMLEEGRPQEVEEEVNLVRGLRLF